MAAQETRVLLPEDLKPINSLEEYKAAGGLQGLEKARSMSGQELIDLITKAGLRGRGGAGFPTGIKWNTVYNESGNKYVVCNFAEGEPGTFKDRYLISKNPYLMFEGLLITAHAMNAKEAVIGTKEKFTKVVPRITKVKEELEAAGIVEPGFIRIVLGPDEYLFGEEEVLVEARHLVNGETAHWEPEGSVVACHGLLLRQHCLVEADGCWIDSLYFGRIARNRDLARTTAPGSTLAEDQLPVHNRPARRELLDFEAQMLALARSRSRAPFAA